ncbi:OmpA family protein [bacterium]|nr:OmpA family protein [bacterium]
MRTITLFLITLFAMTSIHLKSQGLAEYVQLMKFKKAERYFEEYSYSKAVEIYKELYISGDSSLISTIANCYFKLGLTDSASEWYAKVVEYPNPPVEDIYNYSEVLSQQGLYMESAKWLKAYRDLNTEDSRPNRKMKGNADPASLLENVNGFDITPLEINTHEAEFAAVPWNDRVIFTSSRRKTELVKREYNWDQNPFLDLYSAKRSEDGSLSDVQKLDKSIETPFHQGPASFTGDGQSVWFTRNNPNSKKGKGGNDILHLTLYSARMTSTKLEDIQPFSYNDAAYSVGQASVSEDGETLYFVSNMPGGYGGTDIYRTTMNDSGDWSTPENLGEFINTEGNEMFPFIHSSGFLFFSSNGHQGLGGLDVYKVHLEKHPQVIDNLNAPINSSKDDFAFVIDKEFSQGYFSSNRSGGVGSDDIYAFTLGRPFIDPPGLREVLSDNDSAEIMSMTPITIRDEGAHVLSEITTDFAEPVLLDSDTVSLSEQYMIQNTYSLHNDLNTNEASVTDSFNTEDLSIKTPKVQQSDSIIDIKSSQVPEGLDSPKNIDESENELLTRTTVALKDPIRTTEDTNEGLIEPPLASHNKANTSPPENFKVGMDLGELLNINIIYFDFDKYEIRPDARIELEKVTAAMLKYPNLTIELSSHTDCRGSRAYNQKLSENRANATAEYLIKYISNADRVTIEGYGESQPVNNCKCETVIDTDCSEEQHQANRRTEFRLLSVN